MNDMTQLHTDEAKAKGMATRDLARDAEALLEDSGLDVHPNTLVLLEQFPAGMRRGYLKALAGKNPRAGIKAFCQICLGFEREAIRACSDHSCPLMPYRPYQ